MFLTMFAHFSLMGMRISFTAEADEEKVLTITFKNFDCR